MNYYKRHLGDYARDTRHLSLAEHGAFCLLLDYYYATEKPIPDDRCERIANAYAESERIAVRSVLREFFLETPEGWRNARADAVIAEAQAKSLKAKESAEARWSREASERNANASKTQCVGDASHKPLAISHKEASTQPDGCPHADIVAAYHDALPANPRMKVWTGTRQANLRARWREDEKRQSLDYWQRFFAHVASSPFLTGRASGREGRAFLPGLDWLVKPENFAKVIEGRYHDAEAQA